MNAKTCRNIKKKSTVKPSRKLLAASAASSHLARLGAPWTITADGLLHASWRFAGFDETVSMVKAVITLSRRLDHHPQVVFGYRELSVSYTTHSASGLTEMDFHCATRLSRLAAARQ